MWESSGGSSCLRLYLFIFLRYDMVFDLSQLHIWE